MGHGLAFARTGRFYVRGKTASLSAAAHAWAVGGLLTESWYGSHSSRKQRGSSGALEIAILPAGASAKLIKKHAFCSQPLLLELGLAKSSREQGKGI